MHYAKPLYERDIVNKAANRFVKFDGTFAEITSALDIVDNWRASHSYPLDTLYTTLKRRASKIYSKVVTAQRIKRLPSIALKLQKEEKMRLTQMQDIGGCRAVFPALSQVYKLRETYVTKPLTHDLTGEKDYIKFPKPTGYRGIHLKYRFTGTTISRPYDGLKIEIQIRTMLQHKWATAVEAAGTFTREALKSNEGKREWLRFFALMSSVFALREGSATVPGTPTTLDELYSEIRQLNKDHHIQARFAGYRAIIPHIEKKSKAKYFLVTLDPIKLVVNVQGFKVDESQFANKAYTDAEAAVPKGGNIQVVLVSVSSISSLRRAYPNYFLDTQDFLREISEITGVG